MHFLSCASKPSFDTQQEVFEFQDAAGGKHTMTIDANAPKNLYIKEYFSCKNGVMCYKGDARYISRLGCDISRHNGTIDWEKLKAFGIEFVILRIGYRGYQSGVITLDECFRDNFAQASKAGLDIGVYFFSQAITEAEAIEEADFVLKELSGKSLQLPVVFDPENILNDEARTDGVSGDIFMQTTIAFCQKIAQAGFEPMVYSNMLWEAQKFNMTELASYKIWYADYEKKPQTPYDFCFWQYTESARVPGVSSKKTDLDIQIIKVQ